MTGSQIKSADKVQTTNTNSSKLNHNLHLLFVHGA